MANLSRRHFLPWDRPLLAQAISFLADGWSGSGPLDLSRLLVIVPTRQSGRRLRESLAEFAAQHRSAVFPPRVLTPDALLIPGQGERAASRLESLLAWIDVLRSSELDGFRAVVPHDPPRKDFSWALRLASELTRVQAELANNRLRLGDVARQVGPEFAEFERWAQLGAWEARQLERLRVAGRRDAVAALVDPMAPPAWLPGIERIVLLAVVDPTPAAIARVNLYAAERSLDVVIHAPESEAASFDEWGRPLAEAWMRREIPLPEFAQRVRVCSDPTSQAERITELAQRYHSESAGISGEQFAVGIADPEVLAEIEAATTRNRLPSYNPDGQRQRDGALYQLLSALAESGRSPTLEAATALLRCPDVSAYLANRLGPTFSAAETLADIDEVRRRHLPADLTAARKFAGERLGVTLAVVDELQSTIAQSTFPAGIARALGTIFSARRLDPAAVDDAHLQAAAVAWTSVLRECESAREAFGDLEADDGWELALRTFGDIRTADEKTAGALELQGWLELLFEDAPHLVLAGFNDGLVPDAIAGDAFLPESLRVKLGLKSNAARFARDAYLLRAILAARMDDGRVDILVGQNSANGDPLRPSRLLFQCQDTELPARVAQLFGTPDVPGAHLPWTRAWRLQIGATNVPQKIAVTALQRWLECPFRFYLRTALRMEAIDPAKNEMDAFDFGTLCHAALEAMGRDPAMRECADPAELRKFLLAEVTRLARVRYGNDLSLPLSIQLESARQRLGKMAELQARERSAGWVIQEVERPFSVAVGGITVNGKIDRIDRHESTGIVRVLDYKTADAAVTPLAAHLRVRRRDEAAAEWRIASLRGKEYLWIDLQLPMYRHALAAEYGDAIGCGYVNLPKAVGQTALSVWDEYGPEWQLAAIRCAEGVCQAIGYGRFWPPNEAIRVDADDFASLFHRGVAPSVEWPEQEARAR